MREEFLANLYDEICDYTDIRIVKLAQPLNAIAFINSKEEAVILFFTENVLHDHTKRDYVKLVTKRLVVMEPGCITREIIEVSPKDHDKHRVYAREIKRCLGNHTSVSKEEFDVVIGI